MIQVNRSADCGNSPKNKIAEDIAVALETRNIEFVSTILDANATWNYEGGTVRTAESILNFLATLNTPLSITVDSVVSHGKAGAVNGETSREKGAQRFCYVIEFTSVKCNRICRIESYIG